MASNIDLKQPYHIAGDLDMMASRPLVSLQTSRVNTIQRGNRIYSSLSDQPINSWGYSRQSEMIALPSDWVIAPDDDDSRSVINSYYWNTEVMMVSSGTFYYTAICWWCNYYQHTAYWCHFTHRDSQYGEADCASQILILT